MAEARCQEGGRLCQSQERYCYSGTDNRHEQVALGSCQDFTVDGRDRAGVCNCSHALAQLCQTTSEQGQFWVAAVTSSNCSCELRLFLCWCQELHFCCLQHIRSQATLMMSQSPYCVQLLGPQIFLEYTKHRNEIFGYPSCQKFQTKPYLPCGGPAVAKLSPRIAPWAPKDVLAIRPQPVADLLVPMSRKASARLPQVTKQGTIMNIKEPYILVSPLKLPSFRTCRAHPGSSQLLF